MREEKKRLNEKYRAIRHATHAFAGYPCNLDFDYEVIYRFMRFSLNNAGDAFANSNYQLNTHEFEKEVIGFVAGVLGETSDYWGYVTNGGSEGNLCGMHFGRERYPNGRVYYSEHSHYSIEKATRITRSEATCIPTQENGEIDYDALKAAFQQHHDRPVIMMANVGTTMTGAIDDIPKIRALLKDLGIKEFYIHADGALHGLMLPFWEGPKHLSLSEVDSISISGHKFIGSPLPCGLFISHALTESQQNYVEYVELRDATITGSRNGLTPLILWYALHDEGKQKLAKLVSRCKAHTEYALKVMKAYGIEAWVNPQSNIVVFPKPSDVVLHKWQLAPYKNMAHMIIMPHLDRDKIDLVVDDLVRDKKGEAISADTPESLELGPETKRSIKRWSLMAGIAIVVAGVAGLAGLLE